MPTTPPQLNSFSSNALLYSSIHGLSYFEFNTLRIMATIALCRGAVRRSAAPVVLGLSTGLFLANRQRPMRLDAMPASQSSSPATERIVAQSEEWLNPEIIKQLSGGSLAGMW